MTAALSWGAARCLGPLGLMDIPEGRRRHQAPVPLTGGLSLFAAGLLGLGLGWLTLPLAWPEGLALLALGLLGFLDDRHNLPARWKALGGLAVALAAAYPVSLTLIAQAPGLRMLGLELLHSQELYLVLLFIMYWSVPHALNLIDGANGLAMGYSLIVLAVLAVHGSAHPFLLGALLALLAFNWPKARHFLGDCGSLPLGLLLAFLATHTLGDHDPNGILWLFAYPILDVSMVVAIRLSRGQSPAVGDRSHLHYQWLDRFPGLARAVVPFLWLNAGLCALGAVATGWLWVFPWLGLASFSLQALVFWTLTLREHRQNQESLPAHALPNPRPVLDLEEA